MINEEKESTPLSKDIDPSLLHSRGISLRFLTELVERVGRNEEAVGIVLKVTKKEIEDEGRTIPAGEHSMNTMFISLSSLLFPSLQPSTQLSLFLFLFCH